MGWLLDALLSRFEEQRDEVFQGGKVMMISGCKDKQTSADVADVEDFQLPDPAGRAGGACTSVFLNVVYADEKRREDDLSFVEVLEQMRHMLREQGYDQIPQLTSSHQITVDEPFDLVPPITEDGGGVRRALLIGINYVGDSPGELSGCHNDVYNMIVRVHRKHTHATKSKTNLL